MHPSSACWRGSDNHLGLALATSLWGFILKVVVIQVIQVVVVVQDSLQGKKHAIASHCKLLTLKVQPPLARNVGKSHKVRPCGHDRRMCVWLQRWPGAPQQPNHPRCCGRPARRSSCPWVPPSAGPPGCCRPRPLPLRASDPALCLLQLKTPWEWLELLRLFLHGLIWCDIKTLCVGTSGNAVKTFYTYPHERRPCTTPTTLWL